MAEPERRRIGADEADRLGSRAAWGGGEKKEDADGPVHPNEAAAAVPVTKGYCGAARPSAQQQPRLRMLADPCDLPDMTRASIAAPALPFAAATAPSAS
ncbi:MAG TPA: hypothetical protein VGR19_03010 [Allosphingosinicella sp.]|nr:hypothetical protein [Allosphingosinicella sp.]